MNIDEVYERVQAIKDNEGDPEIAHSMEDALYRDYVSEMATGRLYGDKAELLAALILKTQEADFPRWMA